MQTWVNDLSEAKSMIIPKKLQKGDEIRVVAPARSLSIVSEENRTLAQKHLETAGYRVTFSKHCFERDIFDSSSVEARIEDIHEAFRDTRVKAILAAIGGFNSNQLLPFLDYGLIAGNPKILCGYSDITALANAITAKTGMVTYSGPSFSTWAMKKYAEYTRECFDACLAREGAFNLQSSLIWSDDEWYRDQENRIIEKNAGYLVLNEGTAEGRIVGGNLCTLNLLQGTEYMPDLSGSILFLEDDDLPGMFFSGEFERNLSSLMQQSNFSKVRGLVIGRFQKKTDMTEERLHTIVGSKESLQNIPVIAGADFGHTYPLFTFPIGGTCQIVAQKGGGTIEIMEH